MFIHCQATKSQLQKSTALMRCKFEESQTFSPDGHGLCEVCHKQVTVLHNVFLWAAHLHCMPLGLVPMDKLLLILQQIYSESKVGCSILDRKTISEAWACQLTSNGYYAADFIDLLQKSIQISVFTIASLKICTGFSGENIILNIIL